MPTRLLRDGILSSETVDSLSPMAEIFYRRLMSVVDDYGRFYAKPSLLKSYCYPLRGDSVKESDISGWLDECCKTSPPLVLYYPNEGKPVIEVQNFKQQIRLKEGSKFPTVGTPMNVACKSDAKHEPSTSKAGAHLCEGVFGVECEVGPAAGGDTLFDSTPPPPPPKALASFDDFWAAYPKRQAKGDAERAWKKIRPDTALFDRMLAAIKAQQANPTWADPTFIPHPATWLNAKRWEDEVVVAGTGPPASSRSDPGFEDKTPTIIPGDPASMALLEKMARGEA